MYTVIIIHEILKIFYPQNILALRLYVLMYVCNKISFLCNIYVRAYNIAFVCMHIYTYIYIYIYVCMHVCEYYIFPKQFYCSHLI